MDLASHNPPNSMTEIEWIYIQDLIKVKKFVVLRPKGEDLKDAVNFKPA